MKILDKDATNAEIIKSVNELIILIENHINPPEDSIFGMMRNIGKKK